MKSKARKDVGAQIPPRSLRGARRMSMSSAILSISILWAAHPAGSAALPQVVDWLTFVDSPSLLQLDPFADDPGGDPLLDDQEKDVAVGDLNRDGWLDLVVVRKRPFSVAGPRQDLLLINEQGVLVDRTDEYAAGFESNLTDARDVYIGDFDADGWRDVVIANTFTQQPRFYRNRGDDAGGNWLGLADESFRLPLISSPNVIQFCAVWGGDVDGDLSPDIYLSNYKQSGGTTDVLLINDGSGSFSDQTSSRLGNLANVAFGTSVEIHDMDNDGDRDVVKVSTLYAASPFGIGQFVLYNTGSGNFSNFFTTNSDDPYMFTVGHLNHDGMLDMFMVGDNQDRVFMATNVAPNSVQYQTTTLATSPRTTGFGGNTKMADLDGDGDLDVGVGPIDVDIQNCGFSSDLALLENPGSGIVFDPWPANDDQNFHLDPHDFAFLDIDNDGCEDLFMGRCTGWKVFIQDDATCGGHRMSCYGYDYGSQPFIDSGWGYHALYWKHCRSHQVFNAAAANPPLTGNPPSASTAGTLDSNEANLAVFPGGNPSGGWTAFSHAATTNAAERLILAAALFIDRWHTPVYVNVDLDLDGTIESNETLAIRNIHFQGTDPRIVCDGLGWHDPAVLPPDVAIACATQHNFTLLSVDVASWESGSYQPSTFSGSQFNSRVPGCSSVTYVGDPPGEVAAIYRAELARREKNPDPRDGALPACQSEPEPF